MPLFQILRTDDVTRPYDEWDIYHDDITSVVYAKEITRRQNFDAKNLPDMMSDYLADKDYYDTYFGRWTYYMRAVPVDQDFTARMAARTDYVEFPHYQAFSHSFAYPEIVDGKVHYYLNVNDAKRDKRTVQAIGRYLRACNPFLDDAQIEAEAAKYGVFLDNTLHLKFALTREEIKHVYINGPSSCMSGGHPDRVHATEAYACHPIAVAYLERDGDILARTVVNTQTKEWVRFYGDHARLRPLLQAQGYSENRTCLRGFKILNLLACGVPYLDGDHPYSRVSECGEFYLIDPDYEEIMERERLRELRYDPWIIIP